MAPPPPPPPPPAGEANPAECGRMLLQLSVRRQSLKAIAPPPPFVGVALVLAARELMCMTAEAFAGDARMAESNTFQSGRIMAAAWTPTRRRREKQGERERRRRDGLRVSLRWVSLVSLFASSVP